MQKMVAEMISSENRKTKNNRYENKMVKIAIFLQR